MKLSDRELATVLAALRLRQAHELGSIPIEQIADEDQLAAINDIADAGGTVVPLTADEIDALCEWLNGGRI